VVALLEDGFRDGRRGLALAALEVLGRCGGAAALERLGRCLESSDEEVASAAAGALGAAGDPGAEEVLVGALAHPSPEVRTAVVQALGRAGTVAAVPLLREVALGHGEPRRAAIEAIAAIQSRAGGAAQGQLALAAGESGELALAEGEPGRVSLAEQGSKEADRG
jgi:HEAT repeat protein